MLTGINFMGEQEPPNAWVRQLGMLSVIVVDLLGYTGGGIALGYLATRKLGAPWWVLLLTSVAGLSLAMYRLYQRSRKDFWIRIRDCTLERILETTSNETAQKLQSRSLLPFLWTGISWGVAAVIFVAASQQALSPVLWVLGLWSLSMLDLLAIAQVIRAAMGWSTLSRPETKAAWAVQTAVWGAIKLACLGAFGFVLLSAREVPSSALLIGMGTLLVVPLGGGLWWSHKELSYAWFARFYMVIADPGPW
jgi:hypothetical protein